ncbi:MAG: class I SAM-dependent methyltransferase, partial [Nitrospiraceae bacterium]
MPSLEWNKQAWDSEYDWKQLGGNNWSAGFGNAESQWFASIYPRLHNFLPAETVLEIAPGAGRWTQFLMGQCKKLIAVDYSQQCVNICRERFAEVSHATFHVNDGKSLAMVPDHSVDFVFSFDSLVHIEADTMKAYTHELVKKLTPNGVGFIHHSNLNEYAWMPPIEYLNNKRLLWRISEMALKRGLWLNTHSRGRSMSAKLFERFCQSVGLQCIRQELVNWGNRGVGAWFFIDCLSLFTPKGSQWERKNIVLKNRHFLREVDSILKQSML